jgi:hypothetical protein
VIFDETALCPRDVFECAGDKEMEESIFVDEGLKGVDGNEDEPLLPSTSSPEHVSAFTATRPDIQFIVYLCVRFQASPRSLYQMTVQ